MMKKVRGLGMSVQLTADMLKLKSKKNRGCCKNVDSQQQQARSAPVFIVLRRGKPRTDVMGMHRICYPVHERLRREAERR